MKYWALNPIVMSRPPSETPVASIVSAFARDAMAHDVVPVEAFEDLAMPSDVIELAGRPGNQPVDDELLLDRSRLLLSGIGSHKSNFFAVPTRTGRVLCLITEVGAQVVSALLKDVVYWCADVSASPARARLRVFGIASAEVERIAVEIDGAKYPAELGNNAFFSEAVLPSEKLRASASLVCNVGSGKVRSFEIFTALIPQEPGAE